MNSGEHSLAELVSRARLVADAARSFDVPVHHASRFYGVGAELLAQLGDLGFPLDASCDDGPYFDRLDLQNIALNLNLPSIQAMVARSWGAALESVQGAAAVEYTLRLSMRCPARGTASRCRCRFSVTTPAGRVEAERYTDTTAVIEIDLTLTRPVVPIPAAAELLAEPASRYHFWILHDGYRNDVAFSRKTLVADCGAASRLVKELAEAEGLVARTAYGVLVAKPYCVPHSWTEIRAAGAWIPIDPVFLSSMRRLGYMGADVRPLTSPAGIVARIADTEVPLATHDDEPVPVSISVIRATPVFAKVDRYRDSLDIV